MPATATSGAQSAMVRYERESELTMATGIVSSEISRTIPMMRIERTIVTAISAAIT